MNSGHLSKIIVRNIIIVAVVIGFSLPANGNTYSLINNQLDNESLLAQRTMLPAGFPPALRSRVVTLNPVIASPDALVPGDVITLNLFADTALTAKVDVVGENVNGTVTVRGRFENYPLGYVIITTTNNNSLASIQIPETGKRYRIQMDTLTGTHYLLEENTSQLKALEDAPSPIPPTTPQNATDMEMLSDNIANGPLDPVTLDVMIVYTPAATSWAGGSSGIANVIAQAVAKGQLALDNSNTVLSINLVYSGEIAYTESGSSSTDLTRLTNTSDGYMDEVHTLRNLYYADVVGLFTKVDDTGGIGWLLSSTSGSPAYAFSISRVQQASWTFTYIHEMGHNMGCGHSKYQLTQPGPGLFSYSAGWRWTGNDSVQYCSVMSYEDGVYTTVAHFSNPSINYQGVPTGDSVDGDNARTLRETKNVIAAYRQPTGLTVSSITPNTGITGSTVNITNLAGSAFLSGATVKLTKTGQSDITATGVTVVSANKITCTFSLTGAVTGTWDVKVTNPDQLSAVLSNGFNVTTGGGTYCSASGGCYEYISKVKVGTIDNTTGCSGYSDYTAMSTTMQKGQIYPTTITNGQPYALDECKIWIDWNQDKDFDDADETITLSGSPGNGPYTALITPPASAILGNTRMRIRITYTGGVNSCGTTTYGEVEDYTIKVEDASSSYCQASGGCYESISAVQVGSINNTGTGCNGGYADYTSLSTTMQKGTGYPITVTNSISDYYDDRCGIWVDWNQDKDFDDAGEAVTVSGSPGIGPYTATITPPTAALVGSTRLRVRIVYAETPLPCGVSSFGETEDYTITVATPPPTAINISGYVKTAEGVRIKGVNVTADTGQSTVTDAFGKYSLTLTSPYTGAITPAQTDWSFGYPRFYISQSSDINAQDYTGTYNVAYGDGFGTYWNPYLIYNAAQLNAIGARAGDWGLYFTLMADIDLSGYDGKAGRPSFNRIGYYINFVDDHPFTGVFDGGGHTISNFTFDSNAGNDGVGLFGYVSSSGSTQINNVKLTNVDVNSTSDLGTGALIGWMFGGTVTGCSVQEGNISGLDDVGGLIGMSWEGTISNCSAKATVSGDLWVGGLLGSTGTSGTISDSNASCIVTGGTECGGLIGSIGSDGTSATRCSNTGSVTVTERGGGGLVGVNQGTIQSCYSTANVTGSTATEIGGLAGRNLRNISNSYAMGNVSGLYPTGGLAGLNWKTPSTTGSITNCYSTGTSTGSGLIGYNIDGVITGSLWDTNTSGKTSSDGGTGKTTAEMKTLSTFTNAGWDFLNETVNGSNDIWYMKTANYPRFVWQDKVKYGGGTGTPNDPYLIYNAVQMNTIGLDSNDWNKHFKLMADIGLSVYTGQQFNIIGTSSKAFSGSFQGNWHTISNFSYDSTGSPGSYIGIFGSISGRINNLGLINPTIRRYGGTNYAGALAGKLSGTMTCCYASGGSIAGDDYTGGLVGSNSGGFITNCWSSATVNGRNYVGGLVGSRSSAYLLANCYARGNVTGQSYVGGLLGYGYGLLNSCYSTGSVSGTSYVGGLVGAADPNYTFPSGMFWDTQTSGQATSAIGEGKTTGQMIKSTFTNAGWDFVDEVNNGPSDDWAIPAPGGYPVMWYQLSPWPATPAFAAGSGTEQDPYQISSELELRSIGHNPRLMDKYFRLMTDLTLSDTNFPSIGHWCYPFTGGFYGQGHKISNLSFKAYRADYAGMFGFAGSDVNNYDHIEINDLTLVKPHIEIPLSLEVGALCGMTGYGAEIVNCHAKDVNISGYESVGGLIGDARYNNVRLCSSTGYISSNFWYTGGLIGYSLRNDIMDCYSQGDVNSYDDAGGLIGRNYYGNIIRCYSSASVRCPDSNGGLIGYNSNGKLSACFCDSTVNPGRQPIGNTTDGNVLALPTSQMYMQSTYTNAGWDFVGETINGPNDIWKINEGLDYPCFAWEVYCPASVVPGDCMEHISSVQVGSISNVTECSAGGYADYTSLLTTMSLGTGYPITITNGEPYEGDECGIWVDWNQDNDFDDEGETISVSGAPANGQYPATITPPMTANLGNTRMRIRIVWDQPLSPCGVADWGETEDYTITVAAETVPKIISWEMGATHGGGIGLIWCPVNSGYVEPRTCGIAKLRVCFDTAMDTSVTNISQIISITGVNGGLQALSGSAVWETSTCVTFTLSSALPDKDTYTVTLKNGIKSASGVALQETSICLTALKGDANANRSVNSQDLLAIRTHISQPVDNSNAKYDINCNGSINSQDLLAARSYIQNSAPLCQ